MNLSEIRSKYPQYNSISDDVLVQKLHDKYYPQMDINEFSQRVGYQKSQPLSEERKAELQAQAMKRLSDAGIDNSGWGVAKEALKGFGKGILGGIERLGAGATFGFTDWVGDKLGTGVKERRQELEDMNGAFKGLNVGLEIVGGIPSGGTLFKGISGGLRAIPKVGKVAQYLAPTATGAVSGGLYGGFENDSLESAGTGAVVGGALGGALDLAGRGVSKAFSAAQKVKGTPRGFENAAGTKTGSRVLNRAVKESDDIADEVYRKAPEAMENLNHQAMDKLDDAVLGVDVKGQMASAKKAYGDFIDENKANQIIKRGDVYYHASDVNGLKEFDINKARRGSGIWVTNKPSEAKQYGKNLYEVKSSVKKPIDVNDNRKEFIKLVKEYDPDLEGFGDHYIISEGLGDKGFADKLRGLGYDAITINTSDGERAIMSLNPKNLKIGSYPSKVSDLGITGLTDNQKSWLNQAWTAGKRNTLEKAGSLGHLDEMSKELNKMVQSSRVANPAGVGTVATPETVALQGLKDKVDDVIEKAGLQNIKAQYRQAKVLEDSFNRGLKFKPTDIKTRNLTFASSDEKNAFAQGLVEQIKMNPETKNIAGKARDLRGALREVLGDKAEGVFKDIDKLDRSYKNVGKILKSAERKLTVPEPINGNFGLIRELIETGGSLIGGTADAARRWATAKSAERAAKYLLNPNLQAKTPLREILAPYLPNVAGSITGNQILKGE